MADFNKPNRDQEYVNALPDTRSNQEALAKMFNGVSALNIPVNSVQFAGGQFNLWDGGNWNVQSIGISGGGTGATTAAGARANLGVISETDSDNKYLKQASNLADLNDKATARTELQVLGVANNLSDVNDAPTAFDNIKQIASQAQAEAGTDNELMMTPLRASQAIEAQSTSQQTQTVQTPSGQLTSGTAECTRIGDVVTITGGFNHSFTDSPSSSTGFIPVIYRPNSNVAAVYYAEDDTVYRVFVAPSGAILFRYFDWAGAAKFRSSTSSTAFTISYTVA